MNNDDLRNYLSALMPDKDEIAEQDLKVLNELMRLTVEYRDKLHAETGEILTVREAQIAIELYWLALKTGKMQSSPDQKIENLIRLWLKEINKLTY